MKRQTVLKKLAELEKQGKKLDLAYRKRAGIFVNYKGSCDFNPETYSGHSYRWYELTKQIKGLVVLNTYCYSIQTAKHISKVRGVLIALGIRYVSLEAPKGLQDLTTARGHVAYELEKALLEFEHARIKSRRRIQYFEKQASLLAKLGKPITKKQRKQMKFVVLKERISRLETQARKRRVRKLTDYLENTVAFRDYDVVPKDWFGKSDNWAARKIAVHQVVDLETLEQDVQNALYNFNRDGFGSVVFYM